MCYMNVPEFFYLSKCSNSRENGENVHTVHVYAESFWIPDMHKKQHQNNLFHGLVLPFHLIELKSVIIIETNKTKLIHF